MQGGGARVTRQPQATVKFRGASGRYSEINKSGVTKSQRRHALTSHTTEATEHKQVPQKTRGHGSANGDLLRLTLRFAKILQQDQETNLAAIATSNLQQDQDANLAANSTLKLQQDQEANLAANSILKLQQDLHLSALPHDSVSRIGVVGVILSHG